MDNCVIDHHDPHPYVSGGPDVAIYRCRVCGHEGRTAHPELSREACATRNKEKARAMSR